jgi:hypothetical protein
MPKFVASKLRDGHPVEVSRLKGPPSGSELAIYETFSRSALNGLQCDLINSKPFVYQELAVQDGPRGGISKVFQFQGSLGVRRDSGKEPTSFVLVRRRRAPL